MFPSSLSNLSLFECFISVLILLLTFSDFKSPNRDRFTSCLSIIALMKHLVMMMMREMRERGIITTRVVRINENAKYNIILK